MSYLRRIFAYVLLAGAPVFGQAVNGSLLGALTDSSGAVVANAKVAVVEQNTGIRRSAVTNDSGNYVFPDLPPGRYSVEAEREGFRRAARQGVDVLVNTTVRVDLTLEPGNIAETVNVVAELAVLQSERTPAGRSRPCKWPICRSSIAETFKDSSVWCRARRGLSAPIRSFSTHRTAFQLR